jgi:hypothetical protein
MGKNGKRETVGKGREVTWEDLLSERDKKEKKTHTMR